MQEEIIVKRIGENEKVGEVVVMIGGEEIAHMYERVIPPTMKCLLNNRWVLEFNKSAMDHVRSDPGPYFKLVMEIFSTYASSNNLPLQKRISAPILKEDLVGNPRIFTDSGYVPYELILGEEVNETQV